MRKMDRARRSDALSLFFSFSLFSPHRHRTKMADDDLDFDFEGTLAKEAETYQGASVSLRGLA